MKRARHCHCFNAMHDNQLEGVRMKAVLQMTVAAGMVLGSLTVHAKDRAENYDPGPTKISSLTGALDIGPGRVTIDPQLNSQFALNNSNIPSTKVAENFSRDWQSLKKTAVLQVYE